LASFTFFALSYFDHDAFMHQVLLVLDAPGNILQL